MKFVSSLTILLITSVTLLYYLLNNPNFLPTTPTGQYNWINISILIVLFLVAISSILSLLIYYAIKIIKKDITWKNRIISSVKYSLLLTIGIFTIFVLNFFNILDITWGIGILLIVLIFSFII
jgi:hypothetical protein